MKEAAFYLCGHFRTRLDLKGKHSYCCQKLRQTKLWPFGAPPLSSYTIQLQEMDV